MEEKNGGYLIKDQITLMGSTYVLGENPDAPSPFVTWAKGPVGGYAFGHYFADEDSARRDLLSRAILDMPEEQVDMLALSLISEDAMAEIHRKERDDNAFEDIDSCLYDALDALNIDSDEHTAIMKNPQFREEALRTYWNQDHSYENEALSQSLEELIRDRFPQYLPEPTLIGNKNAAILFSVAWDMNSRKFCVEDRRLGSDNWRTHSGSYETFALAYENAKERAEELFAARSKYNDVGLADRDRNRQKLIGSYGMSKAQEQELLLSHDEIFKKIEDNISEQIKDYNEGELPFIDICAEQNLNQQGYRLVVWGEENDLEDKFFSVSVYLDDQNGNPDQQVLSSFSESEEDLKSCVLDLLTRFDEQQQALAEQKQPQRKSLDQQMSEAKSRADQNANKTPDQTKDINR